MKEGDQIAIKAAYTRKKGLPFETYSNMTSVMSIKATGGIEENLGDGKKILVNWNNVEPVREGYFYTYRPTVWKVLPGEWMNDDLIDFTFNNKEQDILYKTTEAYTGLISANEKLAINRANVELLSRQVETDRIRLSRGQISLSDVSQSESSLAGAEAQFIKAQNDLLTSKLNYENIIGNINDVQSLDKSSIINYELPGDLNSAIELSKKNNPDLIIAKLEYEQSIKDKSIAKSDLAPTAKLSFERSYTEDLNTTYDEREKDTVKATVSWPFFSGGKNIAKYKKNQSLMKS